MRTNTAPRTRLTLSALTLGLFLFGALAAGCDTPDQPGTIDITVPGTDVPQSQPTIPVECRDGQRISIWKKVPEGAAPITVVWPDPGPCAAERAPAPPADASGG
jgi:hypothetical protein